MLIQLTYALNSAGNNASLTLVLLQSFRHLNHIRPTRTHPHTNSCIPVNDAHTVSDLCPGEPHSRRLRYSTGIQVPHVALHGTVGPALAPQGYRAADASPPTQRRQRRAQDREGTSRAHPETGIGSSKVHPGAGRGISEAR